MQDFLVILPGVVGNFFLLYFGFATLFDKKTYEDPASCGRPLGEREPKDSGRSGIVLTAYFLWLLLLILS